MIYDFTRRFRGMSPIHYTHIIIYASTQVHILYVDIAVLHIDYFHVELHHVIHRVGTREQKV